MQSLLILYSTLAAFGIGVTIVDLFGVLDQAAPGGSGDTDSDGAIDSNSAGDLSDEAAGDSGDTPDFQAPEDYADAQQGDRGSWVVAGQSGTRQGIREATRMRSGRGTLAIAKAIGTLRTGVYFSLGAGPTGLFALMTGVGGTASLVWSAGAGVFIALLAKTLRAFVRRDLDSTIKPEEFLMDLAVICVPVSPNAMGKALVSRYGRETELYVRCKDPNQALQKGETVRIIDMDDECYWVEAQA